MRCLCFFSKTLQQLTKERDELEKVFRLAQSLENQKRDEEKTKKLQELIQTKGIFKFFFLLKNLIHFCFR